MQHSFPLCISAYTAVSAAGHGRTALAASLRERRSGLTRNDFTSTPLATWIGRVPALESRALPAQFSEWECRNNRLAWLGLTSDGFLDSVLRAKGRYGAGRIAIVIGTSTSSIGATEDAYARLQDDGLYPPDLRRPIVHTPHSLGDFVAHALGITSLCVTVATACSSSAKVFAQAARLISLGLADAAVVGGVDTLCGSVLFGFNSLALVSPDPCRPFDVQRKGISLGEAAGFALLEPPDSAAAGDRVCILGAGESSDAYHMSSPHPQGAGAQQAIVAALDSAGLEPDAIDYINLHGTASEKNDAVEAQVIARLFPASTRASSTKGWTGHTLGAAGILEAVISILAIEQSLAPGTLNTSRPDPVCGPQITLHNTPGRIRYAESHSFGFGGSNCVLVFGRRRDA